MVSIADLQLNDAEETPSEALEESKTTAKIEARRPGTPDAAEEQAEEQDFENGDLIEEERKQRAEQVTLAL
jgi:hypothetical protein